MMSKRRPDYIDIYYGRMLAQMRNDAKITQERLGEIIGVSAAQISKYERGLNRIPASMLHRVALALGCLPPQIPTLASPMSEEEPQAAFAVPPVRSGAISDLTRALDIMEQQLHVLKNILKR